MNVLNCVDMVFNTGPQGEQDPPGSPGPPGMAEKVAFLVRLSNDFPKAGSPIAFHDVIYSRQNSYNTHTCYFTSEHPGVWVWVPLHK